MRCPLVPPLVERARSAAVREVRETRAAVRSAARPVVVRESVLMVSALAAGLAQLALEQPSPGRTAAVAAVACWTALLVPARLRLPAAVLPATAPVLAVDHLGVMVVLPLLAYSAARRVRPAGRLWTLVPASAAGGLPFVLAGGTSKPFGWAEEFTGYVLSVGLLLLLPVLAGGLLGRRRPLVRLLRERNAYLERAQALNADKARMQERARIAAEMHDMLGYRLTLISIHAGAVELGAAEDAPRLSGQAELLRTTAGTAMSELRDILGVLRDTLDPASEDADERSGTRSDIEALVDESQRAGIGVDLIWVGPDLDDADPRTRHAVHRVVREALTNVHKHAPSARARVEVTVVDGRVRVCVVNGPVPGTRPRAPGTRQGLVGLDERVTLIHGVLATGATSEGGFAVTADLPHHPPVPPVPTSAGAKPGPDFEPGPGPEPPAPLDAEVLTLPRLLGAGCLGLLVLVPVAGSLVMLAVMLLID